ncbi:DUF2750 domain-containing protein [Neobacillus massiliamazoniensis]|uniref:DUF2750 domain-containing protein n=1 Tax=Neobacillus massiliamazoniensis TaxID=1499688 RepID=A0A0U1P3M8_9BACI|nr:DUF2750 domain-containing protein [Neobacillus massiliamazoniensis]CRK84722.1 hypothetical protein BN000_04769 [Neobacillus massiliamazoniensis]
MSNIQYPRSGLRIRCENGVNLKVRQSCLDFAVWVRLNMEFPIRVVVYLKKAYRIKTLKTKEMATATFFGPYDKNLEPYIRIATGDFDELVLESGEVNAIGAILNSIAHELIHYQQWIEDRDFDEVEEENEVDAENKGLKLVQDYYYGSSFIEEIVKQQKVWSIENEEGIPIAANMNGNSLMPFWSSKLNAEKIINCVPAYREYKTTDISLDKFLQWLTELENEELLIGTNWRGKQLIGHEMEPKEVIEQIHNESADGLGDF